MTARAYACSGVLLYKSLFYGIKGWQWIQSPVHELRSEFTFFPNLC